MPSAAARRSASANTIAGALPPSSRCTRLRSDAAAARDLHARAHRPGDGDHLRGRVLEEGGARARGRRVTTLSTPAGRNSAATSASRSVDEGRRVRGLEHDGVAGGDRRRDLPDRHVERVVPRRDLADDADRLPADERRVAGEVLARRPALEVACGAGEEAELVDRLHDLVGDERRTGLAGVLRFEVGELLGARLHRIRDAEEGELPFGRRRLAPGLERVGCRAVRVVEVRRGGDGRDAVDLLRGGIDQVLSPCRRGRRRSRRR